ncbi:MAG: glutathione synthase [Alphaproteobacteria bacterium]|nr:glutathione synthase [Alphaproteobacteria bacterium]
MGKAVAFQMEPMENINPEANTSFLLALEAQRRGYEVFHYDPYNLSFKNGMVMAKACPIYVRMEIGNHFSNGRLENINLGTMNVVFIRQKPPFDMNYISTTHILEKIHPKTLVVNDPYHVRNAPEKLLVTEFKDLIPPTLISSNKEELIQFSSEHDGIVIKPLYGFEGMDVFHLRPGSENLEPLIEVFMKLRREPVIAQAYLPKIRQGEKRISLINGRPRGAFLMVPAKGEARANASHGATATSTILSNRDLEICEAIGPTLRERGLIFAEIDIIGDYLIEINVLSPSCHQVNHIEKIFMEKDIWNAVEGMM